MNVLSSIISLAVHGHVLELAIMYICKRGIESQLHQLMLTKLEYWWSSHRQAFSSLQYIYPRLFVCEFCIPLAGNARWPSLSGYKLAPWECSMFCPFDCLFVLYRCCTASRQAHDMRSDRFCPCVLPVCVHDDQSLHVNLYFSFVIFDANQRNNLPPRTQPVWQKSRKC